MFHAPPTGVKQLLLYAFSMFSLTMLSSQACAASEEQNEIKVVFRISKQFLDDATNDEITAKIPMRAKIVGFRCSGTIHAHGKVSVDLQTNTEQATFSVDSNGKGYACVTGVRGPFIATGSARGPFTSRTLVQFDGRTFTHASTTSWAKVHGKLQRVTGRRDRAVGRLVGVGIKPLGNRMLPRAEAQAKPIAQRYLRTFVENIADQIVARLNEKTPVEESVNRLFPHTKDWIFHMSSDDEFIQAAFGPADIDVPKLPDAQHLMQAPRLEVWLRSSSQEARLLEGLSKRPLARQLVQKYLEVTLPELAALAEQRSIAAVDRWVVISIGAPDTHEAATTLQQTSSSSLSARRTGPSSQGRSM